MPPKKSHEIIADTPVTGKPLTAARSAIAGQVAENEEFREYVVTTLDRLRTQALMEGHSYVSGKDIADNLLTVRGRILALTDAFNFFNDCRNSTIRKQKEESNT